MQSLKSYWQKLWAHQKGFAQPVFSHFTVLEAVFIAGAFSFSIILWATGWDIIIHLWFMQTFNARWIHEWVWGSFSLLGKGWFQVLACTFFAWWYAKQGCFPTSRTWALSIPALLGTGATIGWFLKISLGRPRPKVYVGEDIYNPAWWEWTAKLHSYPSGHTLTTFCLLATIGHLYPRQKPWLFVLAAMVSLSRVGSGSHWLADILAGAALGYLCGKLFEAYFGLAELKQKGQFS